MNFEMCYHPAATDWFSRMGMYYPAVGVVVLIWVFAMGACLGSFLNVCIWRIPRGESLSKAASHCTVCGTPIHWYDNLPVLSFLILRGRCRSCRTPYSASYFIVELLCGVLFTLMVVKTGLLQQTPEIIPAHAAMIFFAVGCAIIDWKHQIVPDKLTFSMIACGILSALLLPGAWGMESRVDSLFFVAASGAVPAAFVALLALASKVCKCGRIMGWGDVKFILGAGMLIGFPGIMFSLCAGSMIGFITGTVMKRKHIAFCPFLAISCVIWVFAGNYFLEWYKQLCLWMIK
ncbi:MAG: prepilin peptidase [Lentisphaerae bacterium]|nr:prepilin peptidase [Lentisphaerota bacterium]